MNLKLTVRQNIEPSELLKIYLKEIDEFKPLTEDEENALLDIIDAGKAAEYDMIDCEEHKMEPGYKDRVESNKKAIDAAFRAQGEIMLHNQKFVYAVAKRVCQDENILDLINEGNIAIHQAFKTFDRTKGSRFMTHAASYIERNMRNFQNNTKYLIQRPSNIISNTKVMRFEDKFFAENGRMPEQDETFDAMAESGVYFPKKEDMYALDYCSIYRKPEEDSDSSEDAELLPLEYINVTSDNNEYENTIEDDDNKSRVSELLSVLTDKEREIIEMSFGMNGGEPMTNKEISDKFDLSSERIRQIKNTAMEKMRQAACVQA
jgi:RNA polymerase primary sigma factor